MEKGLAPLPKKKNRPKKPSLHTEKQKDRLGRFPIVQYTPDQIGVFLNYRNYVWTDTNMHARKSSLSHSTNLEHCVSKYHSFQVMPVLPKVIFNPTPFYIMLKDRSFAKQSKFDMF